MAFKTQQSHEQKALTSNASTTLQIPARGKIHNLILRFSTAANADVTEAAIRAEIGKIRFTVNGKDLINTTAAKLYDLYEVLGKNVFLDTGVASVLELNIGRLFYNEAGVRDLFGIGTADVQSLSVTVTAGTLATIGLVQAFTAVESVNENTGLYLKFIDYPQSYNSTGDHTVDTLPRDPDASYLLVMEDLGTASAGVIAATEVKYNGTTLKERAPPAVHKILISSDRQAVPSGYFVHSFTDGNLTSRLPMAGAKDLRFTTNWTTSPGAGGYNMSILSVHNFPAEV